MAYQIVVSLFSVVMVVDSTGVCSRILNWPIKTPGLNLFVWSEIAFGFLSEQNVCSLLTDVAVMVDQ